MSQNNFVLAATALGCDTSEKQTALLKIFSISGYFSKDQVWQDLLHLDQANAASRWQEIFGKLRQADADTPDKFNPNLLLDNFYKSELDVKFWENYLLYVMQHAFGRGKGIEFYQVQAKEWIGRYQAEYLEAAKTLGLVERVNPTREKYDEAWIAGANRIGMLTRLIDYKFLLDSGLKVDHSVVITGARESWANFDGIAPEMLAKIEEASKAKKNMESVDVVLTVGENPEVTEEGRNYLTNLARKLKIELNPDQSFIEYKTKAECPPGYGPNRVYLNYDKEEMRKITEATIAEDLIETYVPELVINISHTEAKDGERPTTITTSYNAAKNLLDSLKLDDIQTMTEYHLHVLLICNNPYVERQRLAAQDQANKVCKEFNESHNTNIFIDVEGAGFSLKQDPITVLSELAATFAGRWSSSHPGADTTQLFYQTREHSNINLPCPKLIGEDADVVM